MPHRRSFRRPAMGTVIVAVAIGGAVLPLAGVSSTAPSAGAPHQTAPYQAQRPGQAQRSGQSLDELNILGGVGRPGGKATSTPVPGNPVTLDPVPGKGASVIASGLPDGPLGIPGVMLGAYQRAEQMMAQSQPGCHLSWTTLAGIGKVESGHASGGRVDATGNTIGRILGPPLDGSPGVAAIAATDNGALDGDPVWDHAVGPMQLIPSSWRAYGAGNPDNIYDSALAASRYLCAAGTDLSDPAQQAVAVYRYNHSAAYVSSVLRWATGYRTGVVPTPSELGPVPQPTDSENPVLVAITSQTPAVAKPAAPVVANLDRPTVTNLDQPAVASLDAAPASAAN